MWKLKHLKIIRVLVDGISEFSEKIKLQSLEGL